MSTISPDLRQAIRETGGGPVLITDPQTNENYVLIRAETYQKLSSLFDADDLTDEQKLALLADSGLRAGWNDAAMNDYDDYDAHRP